MTNSSETVKNNELNNSYNEFDLKNLFNSIQRRSKLSIIVASSTLFLSFCYAFLSKPIYRGEFQIVLNQKNKNSVAATALFNAVTDPGIRSLIGNAFDTQSNINTEVEILKSKSVLMPIFNFVKKQKELEGINMKNYKFSEWLSKVKIDLKLRTSVLNVSYEDSSKGIVLPVVEKISNAYKSYPGRDKNRGLSDAIDYFDTQIKSFTDKSEKAYRDFISFSLENNLNTIPTGLPVRSYNTVTSIPNRIESSNSTNFNLDPRLVIQNKIKELEMEKKEVENLDLSKYEDQTLPMFIQITEERSEQLVQSVDNKVILLSELRNFFTEDDPKVINMKNNIKDLNKKLHTKTLDYIDIEIRNLKARMKLLTKPKNVVIKSKEMQRELVRLDNILVNLENTKGIIALQLAEETTPWQIISTPFMDNTPVAPKKKQIVALGLIAGVFLAAISALFADRYSGFVYSLSEFKSLLNFKLLKEIDFNKSQSLEDSIGILSQKIRKSNIKELGIAFLNKNNLNQIKDFTSTLEKSIPNVNIATSYKLMDLRSCEDIILIVSKGNVKKEEIVEFNQKFQLLNKPLLGWIYFNID